MVYTYNQGVLLSGQRGLYEATGAKSYLEDGHELVADVIAATGWNLKTDSLLMDHEDNSILGKWHGLGRSGIVEEACDAPGYCSQDGQTFKGILFHHLTLFCDPLPDHLVLPDDDVAAQSLEEAGKFGMWWGAPVDTAAGRNIPAQIPDQAVDYRNLGTPESWNGKPFGGGNETMEANSSGGVEKRGNGNMKGRSEMGIMDLNDRGRGRTVETQGGGLALLRAQWELVDEVGA
ncbi:hypothetical protein M7I_1699 [Glarea lozoyensis 74030]|uniref:Uncharacterized protein n=1 Tax=Glarea lozoyensis (strain ATCC 74030 / MF5533) TaxID=1104152 RepID=H0EGS9_GLAL7|nr:hypothetical protein M7I_1699 [Glarea lozoyensis 74030]